ncbi:hypothetical protein CLOP_g18185, partial [Closterium sp. NIES-67]
LGGGRGAESRPKGSSGIGRKPSGVNAWVASSWESRGNGESRSDAAEGRDKGGGQRGGSSRVDTWVAPSWERKGSRTEDAPGRGAERGRESSGGLGGRSGRGWGERAKILRREEEEAERGRQEGVV